MAIPESRLYTRLDISDDISVRNTFSADDGDAPAAPRGGAQAAPEGGAPGTSPAAPRLDGLDTSPGGVGRQSTPCNRLPDSGYVSTNLGARVAATQPATLAAPHVVIVAVHRRCPMAVPCTAAHDMAVP